MTLEDELAQLSPAQRAIAEDLLALRAQAKRLAKELEADETDVFHQLQHLRRSPAERLRIGLTHARLRSIGAQQR